MHSVAPFTGSFHDPIRKTRSFAPGFILAALRALARCERTGSSCVAHGPEREHPNLPISRKLCFLIVVIQSSEDNCVPKLELGNEVKLN